MTIEDARWEMYQYHFRQSGVFHDSIMDAYYRDKESYGLESTEGWQKYVRDGHIDEIIFHQLGI